MPRKAAAKPADADATAEFTEADFQAHVKTYNRFVRLVGWFSFHLFVLLVALYFAVIAGNWGLGLALVLAALAVLIYGTVRERPIRRDLTHGLALPADARESIANTRR